MTAGEMIDRALARSGESAEPVYYTSTEALAALNVAERTFALLTLCLESTVTVPLAPEPWHDFRAAAPDILVPLRATAAGRKVRPASLSMLDARNENWQRETGTPESYCFFGMGLTAVHPHPAVDGTGLDLTFAYVPPPMLSASAAPRVPEEHHPALIDFAVVFLRAKEGGDEFFSELWRMDRFLDAAAKMASLVRRRSEPKKYDTLPFELERFDRKALMAAILKRGKG